MRTSSEIRSIARADLSGHWLEAALLTFVYMLISSIFNATVIGASRLWVPELSPLFNILFIPMAWSFLIIFLVNHRKEDIDPFDITHLFDGYRHGQFLRFITTGLLMGIYVFLWSLLLIIPGIIKALSYSMTPFILHDRPDLKNNGAIELSMDMMRGHKADLFWLILSFLGWGILCLFTLGIGFFWLTPYITASMAAFYEEVKADYEIRFEGREDYGTSQTDNYDTRENDNYQK